MSRRTANDDYVPPEPTQFVRMLPYCVDYTGGKDSYNYSFEDHLYLFATLAKDTILYKQCYKLIEKTRKARRIRWDRKQERYFYGAVYNEKYSVYQNVVVKLLCKAGTQIGFHIHNEKMRVSKVDKVLSIESIKGNKKFKTAYSHHRMRFTYEVGKGKTPDRFSKQQETCAGGIHCYLTRREAERHS